MSCRRVLSDRNSTKTEKRNGTNARWQTSRDKKRFVALVIDVSVKGPSEQPSKLNDDIHGKRETCRESLVRAVSEYG